MTAVAPCSPLYSPGEVTSEGGRGRCGAACYQPEGAVCVLKVVGRSNRRLTPALTRVWLNGVLLVAVADSGASHSCINVDVVSKLGLQLKVDHSISLRAVDAQSNPMRGQGVLGAQVQFPNTQFAVDHDWHVLAGLPYDLILGVDFFDKYAADLSFRSGFLSVLPKGWAGGLGQSVVHTPIYWYINNSGPASSTPAYVLAPAKMVFVGPGQSQIVDCQFQADGDDARAFTGLQKVLGSTSSTGGLVGVLVAKAVVLAFPDTKRPPKSAGKLSWVGKCQVLLTNVMEQSIRLQPGVPIGMFEPVDPGDSITLVADPAAPVDATSNTNSHCQGPDVNVVGSPTSHSTGDEAWLASIPSPHPSRAALVITANQELDTNTTPMSVDEVGAEVVYPPGVDQPETFDLPGIAPADRPAMIVKIKALLSKWLAVFSLHDNDYGLSNVETLFIDLTTDTPIYRKPYNIPIHLRPQLQKQLQDLLKSGVIEPANSPYSAPIVLVAKKDGSIRLCLDFRRLNLVTKKDGYPLPRIDTSLSLLSGAKVFSAMDLVGGYHQVPVAERDRHKLAFASPWGQFQYVRAPFGVVNMPALFSRMMNTVFAGLLWVHVLIYLDDILCLSPTVEDHIQHLEQVFERLSGAGLKLKGKKCAFFKREVLYLGHRVSAEGIQVDPVKVAAIKDRAPPTSLPELRSVMGLFSYYRTFVPNFGTIAEPLTRLMGETPAAAAATSGGRLRNKKDTTAGKRFTTGWHWGNDQETAFNQLKQLLINAPILAHPVFTRPFIVDADASMVALGAVCSQLGDDGVEHPVAFASRALSKTEKRYSATKREALGVHWAVHKAFHYYTFGAPFLLRTDHSALIKIFGDGATADPLIARWQMNLAPYAFELLHRPGIAHGNADGLSRPTVAMVGCVHGSTIDVDSDLVSQQDRGKSLAQPLSHQGPWNTVLASQILQGTLAEDTRLPTMADIRRAQQQDPGIRNIITYINTANESADVDIRLEASRCILQDDTLLAVVTDQRSLRAARKVTRIYLPPSLLQQVLMVGHDDVHAGHLDVLRTFHRIGALYWWPSMWRDITKWVESCRVCQKNKTNRQQRLVAIHEGFQPAYPFQYVSCDITELRFPGQPVVYLLVFLDLFTRWVEVRYTTTPPTGESVAQALLEDVVARHGIPEFLVTDNGPNLCVPIMADVCKVLETKRIFATIYSPQINGAVERFNRTIKDILTTVIQDHREQWTDYLPQVLLAYRTAFHATLQDSPFFVLYGRDPRTALSPKDAHDYSHSTNQAREQLLRQVLYARRVVKINMVAAAARSRSTFNSRCKETDTLQGLVLYYLQPAQRDMSLPSRARPVWDGPYRIIRQKGPITYVIQLVGQPNAALIQAKRQQLKPFTTREGDNLWVQQHLQQVTATDKLQGVVEKILQHRGDQKDGNMSFKIRWEGFTYRDDTWELYSALSDQAKQKVADYLVTLQPHQ